MTKFVVNLWSFVFKKKYNAACGTTRICHELSTNFIMNFIFSFRATFWSVHHTFYKMGLQKKRRDTYIMKLQEIYVPDWLLSATIHAEM